MNQVPSVEPVIETSRAVDSQSIFLKWRALPQKYVNGILRGYTIRYDTRYGSYSWRSLSVSADQLQVTITGLTSCEYHQFQISAFTSKGEGPRRYVGYIKTCMYWYWSLLPLLAPAHVFQVNIKIPLHVTPSNSTRMYSFLGSMHDCELIKSRFVQSSMSYSVNSNYS